MPDSDTSELVDIRAFWRKVEASIIGRAIFSGNSAIYTGNTIMLSYTCM